MKRPVVFGIWQSLLERILEPFPAAALVSLDGDLLVSRYQALADIGTLPVAALTCHQYFRIRPGDVVIINDPYSGGSVLSSINLVTAVNSEGTDTPEALLVVRIPFKPKVVVSTSVEAEGIRIPPTPLVQKNQVNQAIWSAICSHPLAPPGIEVGLEAGMKRLQIAAGEIRRLKALTGASLTKKHIKDWMALAQSQFSDLLHDLSEGTARGEVVLSPKSRIALSIEVKDHRVSFNFTGSGAPDRYALSDSATLGACIGALTAALNVNVPINSGVVHSVDVVAPLGSVVHAKYPAPVALGFTDGTAIVAGLVLRLLGQIDRKLMMAQGGLGQCAFEIDFGGGRYFYDDVEPGSAATKDRKGSDSLDLWRRSHLQRSVEAIERLYPIKVGSVAVRSQSGGSGQWVGGDGQTKVFELLAKGTLRWSLSRGLLKPEGALGGKSAIGPEMAIQRLGQPKEILGDQGELALQPGDQVVVQSGGGGGVGEVALTP